MNYSNAFRHAVRNLFSSLMAQDMFVEDYDDDRFLCYLKSSGNIKPLVVKDNNYVKAIILEPDVPALFTKAEALIENSHLSMERVRKCLLNDTMYYVGAGMLMDNNNIIHMIKCDIGGHNALCFDYSMFKYPEEPINRFILRKLIPYLAETNKHFTFINTGIFLVKPTFQGELDPNLVSEFLKGRINKL